MKSKSVAIIVAHPDDEILWAGGLILLHPFWNWFIISLSRKNDKDRASKFQKVLKKLQVNGIMGDLDDGPKQFPLDDEVVEEEILKLLPSREFDLIISHDPKGEYTRHKRHEEVGRAVIRLWDKKIIKTTDLWTFAYEDGGGEYLPKPLENTALFVELPEKEWNLKYEIITKTYGFDKKSWEARATPKSESFRTYTKPSEAKERFI